MNDAQTTLQQLKDRFNQFRDERDWSQFHDPKNLAEAIAIEGGELLELFLWKTKEEIQDRMNTDPAYKEKIREELADVLAYTLSFSNTTGIDLTEAFLAKIEKNEKKYPVEKARGSARKYTEL